MKKAIVIVLLISIMVLSLAVCVSCSDDPSPNADPYKVKEALEKLGYIVTVRSDSNEYVEYILDASKHEEIDYLEDRTIELINIWYLSEDAPEEAYSEVLLGLEYTLEWEKAAVEKEIKETTNQTLLEKYKNELELYNKMEIGRKGNVVWAGTHQAVLDAQ